MPEGHEEVEVPDLDVTGKSPGWHTAFYYLAEHIRIVTGGAINHKMLYALIGTEGRYYNHENPLVRKRTAGALSRVVHTSRYAHDMRSAFMQDHSTFSRSAAEVGAHVSCDEDALIAYLRDRCWPDVRRGLVNEKGEWRGDLDLVRVDQESRALFMAILPGGAVPDGSPDAASAVMAGLFHIVAFGHLDFRVARSLVDEEPTGMLRSADAREPDGDGACLVKFADGRRIAYAGTWEIAHDRPFTIGRYTDCDVVESDPALSRLHCCVYRKAGVWRFEDLGSRNGSRVLRGGEGCVFDSASDGPLIPFDLRFGDDIVLAGGVCYRFALCASDAVSR